MTSVVVIQARTNSRRLPAKVLLPILELPLVVLAAKRAGNTGRKVIVATSAESSDDYLSEILSFHQLIYFRGSLNNTLERFVQALAEYDDETVVFRLTADNVIPDGYLLDEIEQDFILRNLEYLTSNGVESGLPYGVSIEVTRLKQLRAALIANISEYDKEHVTPYIIRKLGVQYFDKYFDKKMGQYRCSIDNFDDYLCVASLFEKVDDPISEPALDLIERLKSKSLQPLKGRSVKKLVFGCAQLGMDYGVANIIGQPTISQAEKMIKTAIVNGVEYLDTARVYGESEAIIGKVLATEWHGRVKVITKLSTLPGLTLDADEATCHAFVDASLYKSLNDLGMRQIQTLLLHRVEHLKACNGQIWNRLVTHRNQGLIKTLGVSVQTPTELEIAIDFVEVEHIQLPINILDWRWQDSIQKIIDVKKIRPLCIHVRSIYLQGLLNSSDLTHWSRAHVNEVKSVLTWLSTSTRLFGRSSTADLCVAYINAQPWVDGILVGMETVEQLEDNLNLFNKPPLDTLQVGELVRTRPFLSESSLNPFMWSKPKT